MMRRSELRALERRMDEGRQCTAVFSLEGTRRGTGKAPKAKERRVKRPASKSQASSGSSGGNTQDLVRMSGYLYDVTQTHVRIAFPQENVEVLRGLRRREGEVSFGFYPGRKKASLLAHLTRIDPLSTQYCGGVFEVLGSDGDSARLIERICLEFGESD